MSDSLPQRLCSEIQLFDLCDLALCRQRSGRFCTDPVLLSRFEKIAEDEVRAPERYISGEDDDSEADGYDGDDIDDRFTIDSEDNGGEDWEDEE